MENKFFNKKEFKPAMTMAEIMIVVLIIAIISLVFIAMPRKNVSKMDKAKYYIAYDMLKRLQDEQMVKGGSVSISGGTDTTVEDNFIHAADEWLNTLPDSDSCKREDRCVALTNGMVIHWNSSTTGARAGDRLYDGTKNFLSVRVDIDGGDITTPADHWTSDLNSDVYKFRLYNDGWVAPEICYVRDADGNYIEGLCTVAEENALSQEGNISIVLPFRVYRYRDNGDISVLLNNAPYKTAWEAYITGDCADRKCVMEAIPPLR